MRYYRGDSLLTLPIVCLIAAVIMAIGVVIPNITFNQNCKGYLKQAADANTVELCKERLDKAIDYIELKGYTTGYTSVFYKTENENIGFWYTNLKACQGELAECLNNEGATQLEKSNLLLKVRETLTDQGEKGTVVTIPTGLAYYPNNFLYGCLRILMIFAFAIPFILAG